MDIQSGKSRALHLALAVVLALVAAWCLMQAADRRDGLELRILDLAGSPATLYRLPGDDPRPLAVVTHGFGGSRQMMEPISTALARAGFAVVAFDFLGHGRNPDPMSRDVTRIEGTTQGLVAQTDAVIAAAQAQLRVTGALALVGHSMATDIVIRAAQGRDDVTGIVAISMYSDAVTPEFPDRLLILSGEWETRLREVALRALHQVDPNAGEGDTARAGDVVRRAVSVPRVEHVGVLYAPDTLAETVDWLAGSAPVRADRSGVWLVAGLAALLALVWPLSRLLPARPAPAHAPLRWPSFALIVTLPAALAAGAALIAGGGVLGYAGFAGLAAFFAALGLSQGFLLWRLGRRPRVPDLAASGLLLAWGVVFALALDRLGAAFLPTGPRAGVMAILALGTVPALLSEAALFQGAGWLRRTLARAVVLVALAAAMIAGGGDLALTFTALPVLILFWVVYGSAGQWIAARRNGGVAVVLGLFLAWALAASTPLFVA